MSQSKSTATTFIFTPEADLVVSFVVGFTFSFIGATLAAIALLLWLVQTEEAPVRAARRDHAIAATCLAAFGAVLSLAIAFLLLNLPFGLDSLRSLIVQNVG